MDKKKQDIVRAATRLFSEKGYHQTSVDEIAKESGIAKASFYKLFPGKEELLLGSLALFQEDLEKRLLPLLGMKELSPKERFVRSIAAYLECTFENKVHLLLFTQTEKTMRNNEGLINSGTDFERDLNLWIRNCLIDVFGERIEPYVWDIAFLMRAVAVEYIRVYAPFERETNPSGLATFIGDIVELVAEGMLARGAAYEPFWTVLPWFCHPSEEPFTSTEARLSASARALARAIESLDCDEREKRECAEVLDTIVREASAASQGAGVAKACVAYLERHEALREPCAVLRNLLSLH